MELAGRRRVVNSSGVMDGSSPEKKRRGDQIRPAKLQPDSLFYILRGTVPPSNHLLMALAVGYRNIFVGDVAAGAAPGPRPVPRFTAAPSLLLTSGCLTSGCHCQGGQGVAPGQLPPHSSFQLPSVSGSASASDPRAPAHPRTSRPPPPQSEAARLLDRSLLYQQR